MSEFNPSSAKSPFTFVKKSPLDTGKLKDFSFYHLHKLAFDNLSNASIIYDLGSGKLILLNTAARRLFGYSKKELSTKRISDIFDINEPGFKKALKKGPAPRQLQVRVTAIKKSGLLFPCEVSSAVFNDNNGSEKVISTIADISQSIMPQKNIHAKKEKVADDDILPGLSNPVRLQDLERQLEEHNVTGNEYEEKSRIAARLSFDGIWEKNLLTGEIFLGEEFEELFGHDIKIKKGDIATDWSKYLHPDDKEAVENGLKEALESSAGRWERAYRFVKPDGSVANVIGIANIIRNADGKATRMIGVVHDTGKQKELEEKLNDEIIARGKMLKEYEENFKLAFNSSPDVLFDIDLTTNEFIISEAYEKEFGYKVTGNMTGHDNWINHVHPDDKEAVMQDYQRMLVSDATQWKYSYRFLRADNSVAHVLSNRIIFRDAGGKAYRLIGSLRDLNKQKALEEKLEQEIIARKKLYKEYEENFKLIFNSSSDVLFISDLITNKLTISGAYEKEFGYKIKSNMTQAEDWLGHVHPDDKNAALQDYEKMLASDACEWKYSYRFLRADNSVATVLCSRIILRNADGKAYRLIGAMHDTSKQKALEDRLEQEIIAKEKLQTEHDEGFQFIFNSTTEVIFDCDPLTNKITASDVYEKEYGYKITSHMNLEEAWISHIHPDDKEALRQDYFRTLASEDIEWRYIYRFLRADDSIANVISSAIILRDGSGKAYRLIGFMRSMGKQKVLEKRLEREISVKEKLLTKAMQEAKENIRANTGSKRDDSVSRLLGAAGLYLDMAKQGGENSEMFLGRSSEYILKATGEISRITGEFTIDAIENRGLCESIVNFSKDAMKVNAVKISCALDGFTETRVNDKFKLNIFRIVQEELNNILQYANAKKIFIGLFQSKKFITLSISHNGIDFCTGKKRKGIGVRNIKGRATSYNGTADYVWQPGVGCVLSVKFPVAAVRLDKESGFDESDGNTSVLVEKIKKIIVEFTHSDETLITSFSEYLAKKFHRSYAYLAHLFSNAEGTTLRQFIISHKIERVKELILHDELNLKEIADKLNFGSSAHLCSQFKKVTGLTPSFFKQLKNKKNIARDYI